MYVDREVRDVLSEDDAEELRGRIEERLTPGSLFVAVLPEMVGVTVEDAATEEEGGIGPVPLILLGLALAGGAAAAIVVARRRRRAQPAPS